MACFCVYKKYTSNSFKMYTFNRLLNLNLDELFLETCARKISVLLASFHVFLSVSESLAQSYYYVYIKSPITVYSSFFKLVFLVIFVHYIVPLSKVCAVLSNFRLSIIHNSLSDRSPSVIVFLLQSSKVLIVQYNPYYTSSCYSSQIVRFCETFNGIRIVMLRRSNIYLI